MKNVNMVFLDIASRDLLDLQRAVNAAVEEQRYLRINIDPAHAVRDVKIGDKIEVYFDSDTGPAWVTSVSPDGVGIDYGRGRKYHTNISWGSVKSCNMSSRPAVLKWKVGEGEWTPPITSHRENGGY